MSVVIFLGPDGAGKSTIIEEFTENLNCIDGIKKIHFKPFILKKRVSKPEINPYKKKPYNLFISALRFCIWLIEYYLWAIKIALTERSKLFVFDRFLYDVNIDPIRYRMHRWIAKIQYYYLLFPRPKFIFLLRVTPENLQNRKQEVTLDESSNQMNNYLDYFNNKKHIFVIDANKETKEIVAEVTSIYNEKI